MSPINGIDPYVANVFVFPIIAAVIAIGAGFLAASFRVDGIGIRFTRTKAGK